MIQLTSVNDLVRVVTSASADIEAHASWVENNAGVITPGRTNTASITGSGTTTVVGSPGSSIQRRVKFLNLRNNHASTSCDVTVDHTDGTNAETLVKATLRAGEVLTMDAAGAWHHYDVNGGEYPTTNALANRGDMEAAALTTKAVTPGNMHYHPGMAKAWCKCGVTGNNLASYNMTSITDTGAGRATFVIATDFINESYASITSIQRPNTTATVTEWKTANVRFGSRTVTQFENEVYDFTATTAVQEDPTSHHMAVFGKLI